MAHSHTQSLLVFCKAKQRWLLAKFKWAMTLCLDLVLEWYFSYQPDRSSSVILFKLASLDIWTELLFLFYVVRISKTDKKEMLQDEGSAQFIAKSSCTQDTSKMIAAKDRVCLKIKIRTYFIVLAASMFLPLIWSWTFEAFGGSEAFWSCIGLSGDHQSGSS